MVYTPPNTDKEDMIKRFLRNPASPQGSQSFDAAASAITGAQQKASDSSRIGKVSRDPKYKNQNKNKS